MHLKIRKNQSKAIQIKSNQIRSNLNKPQVKRLNREYRATMAEENLIGC